MNRALGRGAAPTPRACEIAHYGHGSSGTPIMLRGSSEHGVKDRIVATPTQPRRPGCRLHGQRPLPNERSIGMTRPRTQTMATRPHIQAHLRVRPDKLR